MIYCKNFILIDANKIFSKERERDKDGLAFINETNYNDLVIKQDYPYKFDIKSAALAVLYRCHGPDGLNCSIRDEDKLQVRSYFLNFAYSGFDIKHQDSEKPIQKLLIMEFL